jgi:8-oxo-dGTP pyrophosphatase MutT (NUDIX family)
VKEETGLDVIAIVRYVGHFDYILKDGRRAREFVWQVETNPGEIKLTEHSEYRFVKRLSDLGKDDLSLGIESIIAKFFRE